MKKNISLLILAFLFMLIASCSEQTTDPPDNQSTSKWEKVGESPVRISLVQVYNGKIYAAGNSNDESILITSSDSGKTWQSNIIATGAIKELGFLFFDGINGFVSLNKGLYMSLDGGQTWSFNQALLDYLGYPFSWIPGLNGIEVKGNSIYIAQQAYGYYTYERGVIISNDLGNTWYCPANFLMAGIDVMVTELDTLILYVNLDKVYYTTDNFSTWHLANGLDGQSADVKRFVKTKNRIFVFDRAKIYYSDNFGLDWSDGSHGLPTLANDYLDGSTFSDKYVFLFYAKSGYTDGTIYYSAINNVGWKIFNTELPAFIYPKIFVLDKYLYFAAENGIWRTKIPD